MQDKRWTLEQAQHWADQPWRTGCNFLPSTAINQLEMWQAETFDPVTIDRELGWAAGIGMSVVRVYLHDLAWEQDPDGFLARLDAFLGIASAHGILTLFTIFDDCHQPLAKPGKQPEPRPGIHNSGWVRSPSTDQREFPQDLARLEPYVRSVLSTFRDDPRVWMWDLYNEPSLDELTEPLLQSVFDWAWDVRPAAPLTVAVFNDASRFNEFQLASSDVVSFHHYGKADELRRLIERLQAQGRPLVCSEWLARTHGSLVATHLPIFAELGVSCVNWGLVSGKMQTIFPWGSPDGAPEPDPWFHDLLRPDGSPYDPEEIALFRSLARA